MNALSSCGVLAVVGIALGGCGGKGSDPGGASAASGGAAGIGGASAAGGASAVGGAAGAAAPPAQGAVAIAFANLDPPATGSGPTCPVVHTATAPILVAGNVRVSSTQTGTRAVDGVDGSTVSCSVVSNGGGAYAVFAQIHAEQGTAAVTISINELTIGVGQSDVEGTLDVQDDVTQNAYRAPATEPCRFSVEGASFGVAPGKIWGSVTCPAIVDPASAAGDSCKATGYFIFENCAG
jgi:hypothetical protein